jgi:IPT/TIG domain
MNTAARLVTASLLALSAACSPRGGGSGDPPPGGSNPPIISSFSPTAGGVGTEVTVVGLNFGASPAADVVRFNGTAAIASPRFPMGSSSWSGRGASWPPRRDAGTFDRNGSTSALKLGRPHSAPAG